MTKINPQDVYDRFRTELVRRFKSGELVGKSIAEVNREVAAALEVPLGKSSGSKKKGNLKRCPDDKMDESKSRGFVNEILVDKITAVINGIGEPGDDGYLPGLTDEQLERGLADGRIQLVSDLKPNYRDKHADDLEGMTYFPGIVVNARDGLDRVDAEELAEELEDF